MGELPGGGEIRPAGYSRFTANHFLGEEPFPASVGIDGLISESPLSL